MAALAQLRVADTIDFQLGLFADDRARDTPQKQGNGSVHFSVEWVPRPGTLRGWGDVLPAQGLSHASKLLGISPYSTAESVNEAGTLKVRLISGLTSGWQIEASQIHLWLCSSVFASCEAV